MTKRLEQTLQIPLQYNAILKLAILILLNHSETVVAKRQEAIAAASKYDTSTNSAEALRLLEVQKAAYRDYAFSWQQMAFSARALTFLVNPPPYLQRLLTGKVILKHDETKALNSPIIAGLRRQASYFQSFPNAGFDNRNEVDYETVKRQVGSKGFKGLSKKSPTAQDPALVLAPLNRQFIFRDITAGELQCLHPKLKGIIPTLWWLVINPDHVKVETSTKTACSGAITQKQRRVQQVAGNIGLTDRENTLIAVATSRLRAKGRDQVILPTKIEVATNQGNLVIRDENHLAIYAILNAFKAEITNEAEWPRLIQSLHIQSVAERKMAVLLSTL